MTPGGPLPPPLDDAEIGALETSAGRIATYAAGPSGELSRGEPPLLLVHSVNAAASTYEMRPLFHHYRRQRAVYALDLPGFGLSERTLRPYTPRLMTDAVLAVIDAIAAEHAGAAIDVVALSLGGEFAARAAAERPGAIRSLTLVSPTGFDSRGPRCGPPGSTRAKPALYRAFTVGLWRRPFFNLLTSRTGIRYFLEKTWGGKAIDEGLFAYDVATTRQPGAEHAPYRFIGGYLFSGDITTVYDGLSLPVWLVHGSRGDFVDYAGTARVQGRANWTVEAMPTGAMPHFEQPATFTARYDAFLAGLVVPGAAAPSP